MAEIEEINEVDLLNNIKNRFFKKIIFNNVSTTLIIVNPYQQLESTSDTIMDELINVIVFNQIFKKENFDELFNRNISILESITNKMMSLIYLKTF